MLFFSTARENLSVVKKSMKIKKNRKSHFGDRMCENEKSEKFCKAVGCRLFLKITKIDFFERIFYKRDFIAKKVYNCSLD